MEQQLPPGITEEQIAAHNRRSEQIAAASATPLPGPLLNGISHEKKTVLGFELRPVTMEDIIFLQRIDSPLVSIGEISAQAQTANGGNGKTLESILFDKLTEPRPGETKGEAQARVMEGSIASFFVFTKPRKEVRKLLRKGKEEFLETAMELKRTDGEEFSPADLSILVAGLAEHFASGFATAISYEPDKGESDGSFTRPQALKVTA